MSDTKISEALAWCSTCPNSGRQEVTNNHNTLGAWNRAGRKITSLHPQPAELAEQHGVDSVEEAGRAIESSLAARQLGAVPTGWKLVPELASEEQLRAVLDTGVYHDGEDSARAVLADEYRTMVAAAPSASPSQGIDLGQFRPAVLTAIGFTGPNDHERKHLRSLLDLIDGQRDAAPGVGNED